MKRLQFTETISAPAYVVYKTMLGLENKDTYNKWVSAFDPTSTFEGTWEKGGKMYFVGTDENGKRRGMVSEIVENHAPSFVSIRHYGMLDGETEITTGEQVEKWIGCMENYSFKEEKNVTTLIVEIDVIEEYADYFTATYPEALGKLKIMSEGYLP
ncbi:MAG: hypothetical protein QM534_13155 [Sediminibacterium sp.]|nr:hypothetical protein [Sediminibacterium sp.]